LFVVENPFLYQISYHGIYGSFGHQTDEILEERVSMGKQLLMILVRRGPRAFSAFIEALRLEEFKDLADRLECN
jgi:hypothetical protein